MKRENHKRVDQIMTELNYLEKDLKRINESVENEIFIQVAPKLVGDGHNYKTEKNYTEIFNSDFIIEKVKEFIYGEIKRLNNELETL